MPVATGAIVAIAASSAASSAAATRMAQEAKCKVINDVFDPKKATISEKKEYAECVKLQHPSPASETDIVIMKIAFVIALIGFIIGFVKGKDEFIKNDYVSGFFLGAAGFFLLPIILGFIVLVFCGIGWLFT